MTDITIVSSETLKRMEVLQQISLKCDVPSLEEDNDTMVQAYVIEPNRDYILDFDRKEIQDRQDLSTEIYFFPDPYGEDEYNERYEHHEMYCFSNPHLIIGTNNGEHHFRRNSNSPINLKGCHRQIKFRIKGDFKVACDKCNTFWISVEFIKWNANEHKFEESEEMIPLVIRSSVAVL
jgi:hypothetical protein